VRVEKEKPLAGVEDAGKGCASEEDGGDLVAAGVGVGEEETRRLVD
jgi:hypothetical protein